MGMGIDRVELPEMDKDLPDAAEGEPFKGQALGIQMDLS
jgi:hypothetical protein